MRVGALAGPQVLSGINGVNGIDGINGINGMVMGR